MHILRMITVLRIPYRSVDTRDELGIHGILDLSEGSTLENHFTLLVALWPVDGVFVPPAEPCSAELAHDVIHQVATGDHYSAVGFAEIDVNHTVEQPGRAGRADKVCRMALFDAGQRLGATGTLQQSRSGNELAEFAAHCPQQF